MQRLDRAQFFERLAPVDDERLRKILWNLYWRGSAAMRQRIEDELDPEQPGRRRRAEVEAVDPKVALDQVTEFVGLARAGAYLAGDRRVSPRERTRWRFTFRRLVRDAELSLGDEASDGHALEMLLDLAQETRSYDYFRSEDPIEAARIVVSDEVASLWARLRARLDFATFAGLAAPQLVRWESRYGWTRTGSGPTSEKEASLATVLAPMLPVRDMWLTFADRFLEALDAVAQRAAKSRRNTWSHESGRSTRASDLCEWNLMLLDRLFGGDGEDRLDAIASHAALAGPELAYFRARLAQRRGQLDAARELATQVLREWPGHRRFLDFAREIGAPLPAPSERRARGV